MVSKELCENTRGCVTTHVSTRLRGVLISDYRLDGEVTLRNTKINLNLNLDRLVFGLGRVYSPYIENRFKIQVIR